MNEKVLPCPRMLSAVSRFPIMPTSRCDRLRPSPVPPYLRVVEESPCVKLWKMARSCRADPDTGIRDGNTQGTGHFRLRNRFHSNHHFALLRKFDRISRPGHEDLPQTCWIAKD